MFINAIFIMLLVSQTILTSPTFFRYSVGDDNYVTKNSDIYIDGKGKDVVIKVGFQNLSKFNVTITNANSVSYS